MKNCSKCNSDKPLTEFNKRSNSKDGLRFECRVCQKAHYEANRDHYITKMKENRFDKLDDYTKRDKDYYEANRTEILKNKQQYYIDNKDIILPKKQTYRINNLTKVNEANKKWIKENSVHHREYHRQYAIEYRKKNPHVILWRSVLRCTLIRLGKSKEKQTIELLGYSAIELKQHLESLFTEGMSWDNQGIWHIDHIKPVSKFDPDTPMNIVNALSNLQPLWGPDNIRKSDN